MRDGLPKLKDFPAEFGGSGEAIAEYLHATAPPIVPDHSRRWQWG